MTDQNQTATEPYNDESYCVLERYTNQDLIPHGKAQAMTIEVNHNDWLLGLAKLRASHIIKLITLVRNYDKSDDDVLAQMQAEAQAILDDETSPVYKLKNK